MFDGEITVMQLAAACGLSGHHFSRAFRHSTGVAPHQWLLQRRIEKAKQLLRQSRLPLSEVAAVCGFAHQSHFTRAFARLVGVSPGRWRRLRGRITSDLAFCGWHFRRWEHWLR